MEDIQIEIYMDNLITSWCIAISKISQKIDNGTLKEMLHKKEIDNIHWLKKECQLADSLTKIGGDISSLINKLIYGKLYDPE